MTSSSVPPVSLAWAAAHTVAFALSGDPSTPTVISGRITSVVMRPPLSGGFKRASCADGRGTAVGPRSSGRNALRCLLRRLLWCPRRARAGCRRDRKVDHATRNVCVLVSVIARADPVVPIGNLEWEPAQQITAHEQDRR